MSFEGYRTPPAGTTGPAPRAPRRRPPAGPPVADVERERRLGRLAGGAGLASMLATFVAIIFGAVGSRARRPGTTLSDADKLRDLHDTVRQQAVGNGFRVLGLLLAMGLALYMYWVIRNRGGRLRRLALGSIVLGTLLYGASFWVGFGITHHLANQFTAAHLSGAPANRLAHHLLHTGASRWLPLIDILSGLAFGIWVTLVGLNGQRVGLLTRALGLWGVGAGVALAFLSVAGDAIFLGWLGAVSLIALGYWPGGRPPAWDAGRAIPWEEPAAPAAPAGD